MSKATEYIKETRGEFKHVNWPTRQQAIVFTVVVIIISIFVAFFLGFFDYLFKLQFKFEQIVLHIPFKLNINNWTKSANKFKNFGWVLFRY